MRTLALALAAAAAVAACNQNETMGRRGRIKPLEGMRTEAALPAQVVHAWQPPVPGTVPHEPLRERIGPGASSAPPSRRAEGSEFPLALTPELLAHGQSRFDIYCQPCHSRTGDGDGMVVLRGFPAPPSLHSAHVRSASLTRLFDVITKGAGAMPSYAGQIPVWDRWAIVAYVRALQWSRHAQLDELPLDVRRELPAVEPAR